MKKDKRFEREQGDINTTANRKNIGSRIYQGLRKSGLKRTPNTFFTKAYRHR